MNTERMTGMPIRELVEIFNDPSRFNRCLRLEMNEKDRVSGTLSATMKLTMLPNVTGIELVCCKDFLFVALRVPVKPGLSRSFQDVSTY